MIFPTPWNYRSLAFQLEATEPLNFHADLVGDYQVLFLLIVRELQAWLGGFKLFPYNV